MHLTWVSGLYAGGVGVQVDKQLPVGEVVGEQVRGAGHQRGLATPGMPSTVWIATTPAAPAAAGAALGARCRGR